MPVQFSPVSRVAGWIGGPGSSPDVPAAAASPRHGSSRAGVGSGFDPAHASHKESVQVSGWKQAEEGAMRAAAAPSLPGAGQGAGSSDRRSGIQNLRV